MHGAQAGEHAACAMRSRHGLSAPATPFQHGCAEDALAVLCIQSRPDLLLLRLQRGCAWVDQQPFRTDATVTRPPGIRSAPQACVFLLVVVLIAAAMPSGPSRRTDMADDGQRSQLDTQSQSRAAWSRCTVVPTWSDHPLSGAAGEAAAKHQSTVTTGALSCSYFPGNRTSNNC